VAIITEDSSAKARVERLGSSRPESLHLFFRAGFHESAKIMARAKVILIATLPNIRFSGSTTVGVAAALAKPLVLDDPEDGAGYGLVPGVNCEIFKRGDAADAHRAILLIAQQSDHAIELSRNISRLVPSLDLRRYASALEACFEDDWHRNDFTVLA
jgi:hypothetical protein